MTAPAISTLAQSAAVVAQQFAAACNAAAIDATAAWRVVYGLAGQWGRYVGIADPLPAYAASADTLVDLLEEASTLRATAASAASAAIAAATGNAGDFATAVLALAEAVRAACADPADALRLLAGLAGFTPAVPASGNDAIATQIAALADLAGRLCRRAAGISLARASATLLPASQQQAASWRDQVCAALDDLVDEAAAYFEDQVMAALTALRSAVWADLSARGADVADVVAATLPAPLPMLTAAQLLYQDGSRGDELVMRNNDAPHPLFLPLAIEAAAA